MTLKSLITSSDNIDFLGAVTKLGLPIVLSLIFVWFLIQKVDVSQQTIIMNQAQIMSSQTLLLTNMQLAGDKMSMFVASQKQQESILVQLILQSCINAAKNEQQQAACISASGKYER